MPVHDFKCECGSEKKDLYYSLSDIPRYLVCECGKKMYQHWGKSFNRKRSLTSILGPHARYHPQMGYDVEIESPDHYKQLLKEYDMEEADDTVRGVRDWHNEEIKKREERQAAPQETGSMATEQQVREAQKVRGEGLL